MARSENVLRAGWLPAAWLLLAMSPLASGVALAQVQFEGRSFEGGPPALSSTHTVVQALDRYLVVPVMLADGAVQVRSVVFAGIPLGLLRATSAGAACRLELWALVAPPVGTHPLEIRLSTATNGSVMRGGLSYSGVDQTTPARSTAATTGSNLSPMVGIASEPGDLVVAALCGGGARDLMTVGFGPGLTPRGGFHTSDLAASQAEKPGAAFVSASWEISATGTPSWVVGGISLRPVAAAGERDAAADRALDAPADVQPPPPDAPSDLAAVIDSPRPDAAPPAEPDAARPPDVALADAPSVLEPVDLAVGCACRAGAGGAPPGALAAGLAGLLAIIARRRGRRIRE